MRSPPSCRRASRVAHPRPLPSPRASPISRQLARRPTRSASSPPSMPRMTVSSRTTEETRTQQFRRQLPAATTSRESS
ncbi:hypothetical protein ACFPRL_08040 [Pseudoclavibacter helvolus]